ncbi:uncharacterized protein DNG_04276 [Cephalotrichum gorgonifer]|uniref:Uncharacterized protein n=1 Tax=Cephalotrichum gorgonifer TaxID=2041049 RepID=A0AAE8SUS3_9PEZI|nr:uncharacterized protein DNG_04276 [Cephalotrichum gorgonifer]
MWESLGVMVRELRMMAFIGDITDKPDWERKVLDEAIVDKWRAEADAQPPTSPPDADVFMSKAMFDFCIQELRDKAKASRNTGRVNVLDAEIAIVKSDTAVSEPVRQALRENVKRLEDVPDHLKDWHPGSNGLVLDLVHPSLFPVVYGLTRALPDGEKLPLDGCIGYTCKGTIIPVPTDPRYEKQNWGSHQWLPSDVKLTGSGAKILGYINNLHPEKHKDLYKVLEDIVTATIPLWEDCLNGFRDGHRIKIECGGPKDWRYPDGLWYRIPGREGPKAWYDPNINMVGSGDGLWYSDHEDWSDVEAFEDWIEEHQILIQREPREYIPQAELERWKTDTKLADDYPEGLQIVFKLANIHLTPQSPAYGGGSWHIEGMMNEQICASAIYYYDQENITDSHLAFRQSLDTQELQGIPPDQDEYRSLERYLGIENQRPAVQILGRVLTREGRLLVFPNDVQHQVQPFSLQDPTKTGHRKILAMFLIDPDRRVHSSSTVPPQRMDWWGEEINLHQLLSSFPREISDQILDSMDGSPLSWERALKIREELLEERRAHDDAIDKELKNHTFCFCEH